MQQISYSTLQNVQDSEFIYQAIDVPLRPERKHTALASPRVGGGGFTCYQRKYGTLAFGNQVSTLLLLLVSLTASLYRAERQSRTIRRFLFGPDRLALTDSWH